MGIDEGLSKIKANSKKDEAKSWFQKLVQEDAYVGELFQSIMKQPVLLSMIAKEKKLAVFQVLVF